MQIQDKQDSNRRKGNKPHCHHGRKIIHKKLASNHLKFQPPEKPEEARKPTNRCRRCGNFSRSEYCDTPKRLIAES